MHAISLCGNPNIYVLLLAVVKVKSYEFSIRYFNSTASTGLPSKAVINKLLQDFAQ
jgi:hypothetical protein